MRDAAEETSRFARFANQMYPRQVHMGYDFDLKEVLRIECHISKLIHDGDEPIVLEIHSSGGDVDAALHLRRVIAESNVPIYGLVTWNALSAAFYVLQACHARLAYPGTTLALHTNFGKVRVTPDNRFRAAVRAWQLGGDLRRSRDRIIADYRERLLHLPVGLILKMMREATEFSAEAALELGLIDEIVPRR